jgi:hypothetical protein
LLAKGKGVSLVVLATIFQQSAAEFYIKESTAYNSLADLSKLKTARNVNDLIDVEFQALVRSEGIDIKSIETVQHSPSIEKTDYYIIRFFHLGYFSDSLPHKPL